jgi:cation transport ATPase
MQVLAVVSSTWSRSVATYKKYEPVIAKAWLWMLTIWMMVSSFAYVLFPNFLSDSLDRWILRVWLITGVISVFGLYFLKQILDNLETKQLFGTLLICLILVIAMSILVLYRIKPLYSIC